MLAALVKNIPLLISKDNPWLIAFASIARPSEFVLLNFNYVSLCMVDFLMSFLFAIEIIE